MNRFYVILYKGKVKCIHIDGMKHYKEYLIITKINKLFNPHNVQIVYNYFENNPHHYLLEILKGE